MNCYLFNAPTYLIFATDLPPLLYYSHIPTTVIALLVGLFVFIHNPRSLLNRLLFGIALCFSFWTFISLIAWTNIHGDFLAFIWPFFGVSSALISILSIYFTYVFVTKKDASFTMKLFFLILLAPVLLLGHTDISVSGFNITNCDAFDFEGLPYKIYYTGLSYIAMFWILALLTKAYRNADKTLRKQLLLMGIGLEFFLFLFNSMTFIVTYLTSQGIFTDSRLEFYGLFGMTIFMIMTGILIVKFKTFNVGLLAPQALVIFLLIVVTAQFTYVDTVTVAVLTTITVILTSVVGILLVRSVKHEVEQRQEIEKLALSLEKANVRLKELDKMKSEFVSIASHQLRSPLTSIRGYTSMLMEGSFGQIPEKAKDAIRRISESSRLMALSVEDYLNVSRIQSGNIKYVASDFNLKDMASKLVDDMRREAMRKGLLLTFKDKLETKKGIVNADIGKTNQILSNLIDNALKYTQKGQIEVMVSEDKKTKSIVVDITDTGIGMTEEARDKLFEKFIRADNANGVNSTGTGLGLYIARKMAQDMGGNVIASSPGTNLGSTFTLTLPLRM